MQNPKSAVVMGFFFGIFFFIIAFFVPYKFPVLAVACNQSCAVHACDPGLWCNVPAGRLCRNFSCPGNPTCVCPSPTPTLYPTIAITGILKENNGVSCTNDISSNNLKIRIVPQNGWGITPVCTQNPASGNPKIAYNCTVTFDNQIANPSPAQNLTLNASAPEYQSAYWTDNNVCGGAANNTIAVNVAAPVPTTTFNKDIFFDLSGVGGGTGWMKLSNLSFSGNAGLNNVIPQSVSAYDSEDDTSRYFIIDGAGTAGVNSASSINLGTAQTSANNWSMTSYTRQVGFTPATFLDYVKSRKDYTTIADLSGASQPGIYYINGDLTISSDPTSDFVLIVNGNVTISQDFNKATQTTAKKSVAILANNITIGNNVAYAYGIFIAGGAFDTGTNAALGLKIKGNVSTSTLSDGRSQSNNSQPSLFMVSDPGAFITLLPYLSISKYDQTIQ